MKERKNGRQPQKKMEMNQSTKINLIGCDTIVNSPSANLVLQNIAASYLVGYQMCFKNSLVNHVEKNLGNLIHFLQGLEGI